MRHITIELRADADRHLDGLLGSQESLIGLTANPRLGCEGEFQRQAFRWICDADGSLDSLVDLQIVQKELVGLEVQTRDLDRAVQV